MTPDDEEPAETGDDAESQADEEPEEGQDKEGFVPHAEGQVDLTGNKPPVDTEYEVAIKHKFQTPNFRYYVKDAEVPELRSMSTGELRNKIDQEMQTKPDTRLIDPETRQRHIMAIEERVREAQARDH